MPPLLFAPRIKIEDASSESLFGIRHNLHDTSAEAYKRYVKDHYRSCCCSPPASNPFLVALTNYLSGCDSYPQWKAKQQALNTEIVSNRLEARNTHEMTTIRIVSTSASACAETFDHPLQTSRDLSINDILAASNAEVPDPSSLPSVTIERNGQTIEHRRYPLPVINHQPANEMNLRLLL